MKKSNLNLTLLLLLSFSLLFTSCKEHVNTEKIEVKETAQVEFKTDSISDKTDKMKVMLHATSLPLYMNIILNNKEALHINETQYQELEEFSKSKSPEAVKIANEIKNLEAELYRASLDNGKKEFILSNFEKTLELRANLTNMKLDCRAKVLEILDENQWKELVILYQENKPFNDKKEMTVLIKHVNPLPNYMQLVKDVDIKLDATQEEKLSKWSNENHPRMMELAAKVNTLEKNVYELSILKESKENILKKVIEIAEVKKLIVTIKTDCRDHLIHNILTEDQWKILSSK